MNGRTFFILFSFFLLLSPVLAQTAQPYEINPAKWIFYMKEDYELKPIYFNFIVKNTEEGPITVSLTTIPPEYLYEDQYPGVVAFPNYDWITLSETEVTVPAGQTVQVPVYVNIPEQYYPNGTSSTSVSNYNKSYEAWFLADQTSGPGNIQVDYRCRWVFLTPPKYVPPWERPGALLPFPDYYLYAIIIVVIIVIVAIVMWRRRDKPVNRVSSKSKKSNRKDDDEDDIFR